ncbi:MAG: hypothetical protein MRERV_35c037 [Mycoplasmataceae bacterium RV_VA103A]|nr:MAG: hypothetical protein MRERV_35c037 [Mycoplasmataceae bacterium RV_VA103A]
MAVLILLTNFCIFSLSVRFSRYLSQFSALSHSLVSSWEAWTP